MEADVYERMMSSEYGAQLLKDKKQLQAFPNAFQHLERLLNDEILRVRGTVFCPSASDVLHLPEPLGPAVMLSEKLTIPTKEFPNFNFIGRLLGPRGMTAKQVELDTGCKILVRGQGSLRDKHKEEQMKGKPKWEHLNEELHVLITVEDSKNRATLKLRRATEEVKKLLYPVPECEDELKKQQLIELAILNGTHRGLNGYILSAAATCIATGTPPVELNVFGSNAAIGPSLPMDPRFTLGPSMAMTPVMLPPKPAEQHGLPILFAPPASMTIFHGQLTPLASPGQTSVQSAEIIGNATSPMLIHADSGLLYHFDPYITSPQPSSLSFEYSMALAPQSSSIGLSRGQ